MSPRKVSHYRGTLMSSINIKVNDNLGVTFVCIMKIYNDEYRKLICTFAPLFYLMAGMQQHQPETRNKRYRNNN